MTFMEAVASEAFNPVITLIGVFAKCSALFVILSGIFGLKKYAIEGDHSQYSPGRVAIILGIGVLLWHFDQFLLDWQQTVFGELHGFPNGNPLGYSQGGSGLIEKFASAKRACILFIQIWGNISFLRGLHVWHQSTMGYKNSTFWKGFFHCLGGVIAINFGLFSEGIIEFLHSLNPLRKQ